MELHLLKQTKIYRNNQITIPYPFMIQEKLSAGDPVDIFTDIVDGKRALIIIPQTSTDNIIQTDYKNLVKDNPKEEKIQNN